MGLAEPGRKETGLPERGPCSGGLRVQILCGLWVYACIIIFCARHCGECGRVILRHCQPPTQSMAIAEQAIRYIACDANNAWRSVHPLLYACLVSTPLRDCCPQSNCTAISLISRSRFCLRPRTPPRCKRPRCLCSCTPGPECLRMANRSPVSLPSLSYNAVIRCTRGTW